MKKTMLMAVAGLLVLASCSRQSAGSAVPGSYAEALAMAKSGNTPVLVDFFSPT